MDCRPHCGACCIAPSISSPIPGMAGGKPAGVRCAQLDDALRCAIFGAPQRPACCAGLKPQRAMCGAARDEALAWLARLEAATRPDADETREAHEMVQTSETHGPPHEAHGFAGEALNSPRPGRCIRQDVDASTDTARADAHPPGRTPIHP